MCAQFPLKSETKLMKIQVLVALFLNRKTNTKVFNRLSFSFFRILKMISESGRAENSDVLKSIVAAYQMGMKLSDDSPLCSVLFDCNEDEVQSNSKVRSQLTVSDLSFSKRFKVKNVKG